MTRKQKHKLGWVLLIISTVVNLLNIVLRNHGIPAVKWLGLPLFFLGFWLAFMNSSKSSDSNPDQNTAQNPE